MIQKQNKDTRLLKNLRPITLLNVDYKILEKVLANRLKETMESIINHDQKGSMKNRRISANICKVFDIIKHANDHKINAVICSVDFEKCFDKIEFTAIEGALRFFGYGEQMIHMVKTTFYNFSVVVQNNGFFSKTIKLERGVHQGGPISSYLFLICAEVLAIMLRENPGIKRIPVNEIICLLNQFADDTYTFLLADKECVKSFFLTLEKFRAISGFTVNYEKTSLYHIGSLWDTQARYYVEKNLHWTNDPMNILGVMVDHDLDKTIRLNYEKVLIQAQSILMSWSARKLSLCGKVTVVNVLVASLFVYKMMVLPTIPTKYISELNHMIREFIWDKKKPKISLKTLQGTTAMGGLKLVDLAVKDMSLKISWLPILHQDSQLAALAYS